MAFDKFLTNQGAVDYLALRGIPFSAKTLGKLRVIGGGPAFRKFGRKPLYEPAALDAWIEQRLSAPMRTTGDRGGDVKENGEPGLRPIGAASAAVEQVV